MITPADILKRAERHYKSVLRAWVEDATYTPISFPTGKPPRDLMTRRQAIETLRAHSNEAKGEGYSIEWQTINTRELGTQTTPTRIHINTLDDYLALIRKRTEFNHFIADVQKIRVRLPPLEIWMRAKPQDIIAHHGKWDDLLTVCQYFSESPRPSLYLRELPIAVHTKFIEQNMGILHDLLETILPPETIAHDASTFYQRFGLKDAPILVRLRLLDEQLDWQKGIRMDDISAPLEQVAHLLQDHIRPRHVIIVENLTTFLTLPRFAESVGIFGKGFGVSSLASLAWLNKVNILYWGDIDAHGFAILSDLRTYFPHTKAVMMDEATLNAHQAYIVTSKATTSGRFAHLTEAESQLAQDVLARDIRLEQEHIPHAYAVTMLKQVLYGG